MQCEPIQERYSAEVRLELIAAGQVFDLAKSGPGYAYLRNPAEIPAGHAVFVMTIDGRRHKWDVRLTRDVVPIGEKIEFQVISGPESDKPIEFEAPNVKQLLLFPDCKPA
ncbi:MAG: hypothetical protein EXS05_00830 [Planctomycetaceae bacterium]|nr:hypothetical protein [Planctomycetaceae bacterium]